MMGAALEVEMLKLRRSAVGRTGGAVVVVGVAALAAGFMAVARLGGDSQIAAKVESLVQGTGWPAYLSMVGQILSVATLLSVGIVTSWTFGREFVDGTFGALFATPTPLARIAAAKFAVVLGWGWAMCASTVLAAVILGFMLGLGPPDAAALGEAVRALVVGGSTVLLSLPFAVVASACRGYLPGIAALLGVVVITQVTTVLGAGGWFPYASPGLWAGMGGPAAAADVTWVQLMMILPVSAAGVAATIWWWHHAEVA
jgi:ABC-2 type transport system permease protein